ncbi:uncharacterized protein RHOBADRAFT_44625 [Rhodotorula graminis WP1]|uniref:Uncharacterized protein n=1 Tax=Rhodotorula graminis (strain WP1) TaxID=578459 RepID=A0A194S0S0_RHOGW|nr:uncharacterized protein RHOBADRAFT_44625 [Rhodotorula graminis WP1]KPV74140.1 hypothetical protein RHOBADRAFT_44625 [Rhodotorula graminis WP1]
MARWIDLDRLLRRDGAIRLPVSSADVNHEPESVKSPLANDDHDQLPFVPDADEAAKQGYTSANLLFESLCASVWNAACLVYIESRHSPSPPTAAHLAALVVLLAIPLGVGVVAGAACAFGPGEEETRLREQRGRLKRALCWTGLIGCIAALWPIGARVVRDQPESIQLGLALVLAIVEGVLIHAGSTCPAAEQQGAIALPRTSLDGDDEAVREKGPCGLRRVRDVLAPARRGATMQNTRERTREAVVEVVVLEKA